jgi:transposase
MVKGKEISQEERFAMVEMHKAGVSVGKIAKHFMRTKGGVSKLLKRVHARDSTKNRKGRGRKRKTTAREDRAMVGLISRNKAENAREIVQQSHFAGGSISPSTVQRRLAEAGFVARIKRKKPWLKPSHRAARLRWAREHKDWTEDQWAAVLWSDESRFKLFRSDGREWCWVRESLPAYMRPTKSTVKDRTGVMVWGCFSASGVGNLTTIKGIMDSSYYVDILEDNLIESMSDLFGTQPPIFQHDNDPKHKSAFTRRWLEERGIQVMWWPAQSPDLNPIEHLWAELELRVRRNHKPTTVETLWQAIQYEWINMPAEVTQKLVQSMPKRIEQVIASKGGATDY